MALQVAGAGAAAAAAAAAATVASPATAATADAKESPGGNCCVFHDTPYSPDSALLAQQLASLMVNYEMARTAEAKNGFLSAASAIIEGCARLIHPIDFACAMYAKCPTAERLTDPLFHGFTMLHELYGIRMGDTEFYAFDVAARKLSLCTGDQRHYAERLTLVLHRISTPGLPPVAMPWLSGHAVDTVRISPRFYQATKVIMEPLDAIDAASSPHTAAEQHVLWAADGFRYVRAPTAAELVARMRHRIDYEDERLFSDQDTALLALASRGVEMFTGQELSKLGTAFAACTGARVADGPSLALISEDYATYIAHKRDVIAAALPYGADLKLATLVLSFCMPLSAIARTSLAARAAANFRAA